MKLLPGESIVSETGDKSLTLTTHRVRYDRRVPGTTQVIGITLDAVSSCGIVLKSHPILLLLALVAVVFGVLRLQDSGDEGMAYTALLLAAVLVAAYFLSRTTVLAISSPGQSITVSLEGLKPDALIAWVDDVEQAKLKYLDKITESSGVSPG